MKLISFNQVAIASGGKVTMVENARDKAQSTAALGVCICGRGAESYLDEEAYVLGSGLGWVGL